MKKYKLIKTYPGSPLLDTILEINPAMVFAYFKGVTSTVRVSDILQYPEYWEEIIEKDYEILSFQNCIAGYYHLQPDGNYKHSNTCFMPLERLLKMKSEKIYSVKRLSDGEIFTIGDNCSYGVITGIFITKEGYCMTGTANSPYSCNILYLKHNKKHGRIWFSTKEKAEELLEEMTFRCIECHYQDNARRCAIIAVNEIISVIENGNPIESQYNYWNEVKKELIKY